MTHFGNAEHDCCNQTTDCTGDSVAARKLAAVHLASIPETPLVSGTFPAEHLLQDNSCDSCSQPTAVSTQFLLLAGASGDSRSQAAPV